MDVMARDSLRATLDDLKLGPEAAKDRPYLEAMLQLREYPTPFILSLDSFEQRQATGLQMTRSPGKNVVYFGSVMLVIGIFILFYLPHRKVWVRVRRTEDGGTEALVAGTSNRNALDFEKAFASLAERMAGRLEQRSS